MITVTLQYYDDCPNWQTGRDRLLDAIDRLGRDSFEVDLRLITGYDQAVADGFRGSPSFVVNGRDPFADHHVPVGLTCRSYPTEAGPAGAPTLEQLLQVLERALAARSAPTGCGATAGSPSGRSASP
ncbi:MAG: thioredoxin family protein [Candidatus Nanopelagicales bacterium]